MLNMKGVDLRNQFFSLCSCESVLYNESYTKPIKFCLNFSTVWVYLFCTEKLATNFSVDSYYRISSASIQ
jgi:hypothetical protein